MRIFILACSLIPLLGCCKRVTVTPCPPPPPVIQPTLRTASLTAQTAPDKVLEAYVLDLAEWVGYGKKLGTLLDAYRPTTPPPAPPR